MLLSIHLFLRYSYLYTVVAIIIIYNNNYYLIVSSNGLMHFAFPIDRLIFDKNTKIIKI